MERTEDGGCECRRKMKIKCQLGLKWLSYDSSRQSLIAFGQHKSSRFGVDSLSQIPYSVSELKYALSLVGNSRDGGAQAYKANEGIPISCSMLTLFMNCGG